jgi:hypothetical protein
MNLEAVSIGCAVPRWEFEVSVHSIFRSSVNLQMGDGNTLLTLTAFKHGDLPQGIRLQAPDEFHFDDLSVGEYGGCRDGLLTFQSALPQVSLRNARRWTIDLESFNTDLADPGTAMAWTWARVVLNERQVEAGAEIVVGDLFRSDGEGKKGVAHKVHQAVRALVQATRGNGQDAVSAAGALIGLGAGLTPSGDDLLVGYLAGLRCTVRANPDRCRFLSDFGQVVTDLSRGTNAISRTYLLHAAHGQVSSRLAGLARAISKGVGPVLLRKKMVEAISMGHTSGMDTLTGLLVGLAAWDHLRMKPA